MNASLTLVALVAIAVPAETGTRAGRSDIDHAVSSKLATLGLKPARLCSDHVFVRRVFLDMLGKLPTAEEARKFLEDEHRDKRDALIERLFDRKEFADYWAMHWSDVLRVKSEFPINLWPNAAQAYHEWIWTSMRQNKPYDQFVRELMTSSGSNFRVPAVNFYRAVQNREPDELAEAVALAFMGTRTENWPKQQLDGMAAFFSCVGFKRTAEWKEEIVYFDTQSFEKQSSRPAMFPDGKATRISSAEDPRQLFADWLVAKDNPWFARAIVNRIWYWLFGRGIVHEPDDFRAGNPPSNEELLRLLADELVARDFDLRHIIRMILRSKTYQRSYVAKAHHAASAANFASYPLRRLDAEVLIDALCQVTGTTESYSSAIPEPFTFVPERHHATELPDGSITSPFLEMFGRPPRDTGFASERNNHSTPAQRLHFLNSSHVLQKIERGPMLRELLRANRGNPRQAVDELYLTTLSRFPTEDERRLLQRLTSNRRYISRATFVDLTWALINTAEFQYQH